MILFKACPRCGGDVNAAYPDDVHCVQCAHRPADVFSDRRIENNRDGTLTTRRQAISPEVNNMDALVNCPRCGSEEIVKLEKVRRQDNNCYRCRMCGHIYSPRAGSEPEQSSVALP